MAKHYALGNSYSDLRVQFDAALQDYYGAGVTIHYSSSYYVVFSCPAISDKVLRVEFRSNGTSWFYGDAYVSSYNISNQVQFVYTTSYGANQTDLVLSDDYLLAVITSATVGVQGVALIGEMTNGDFVVAGCGTTSSINAAYNTTQARQSKLIGWNTGFKDASGKLYKQPLLIAAINGSLELNGSSPATVSGIYNASGPKNPSLTVGPDYLITPTNFQSALYSLTGAYDLLTPLYVEFSSSVNWRG